MANPLACFLHINLAGNWCQLTEYGVTNEKSPISLLHPFCSCLRPRSRISPSRHTSDGNCLRATLRTNVGKRIMTAKWLAEEPKVNNLHVFPNATKNSTSATSFVKNF
jgi:hypothetical protein